MQGSSSRSSELHDEGVSFSRKSGNHKGLNVASAAVFIVGEMAGSGVLALPKAIVNSGIDSLIFILAKIIFDICFVLFYCIFITNH